VPENEFLAILGFLHKNTLKINQNLVFEFGYYQKSPKSLKIDTKLIPFHKVPENIFAIFSIFRQNKFRLFVKFLTFLGLLWSFLIILSLYCYYRHFVFNIKCIYYMTSYFLSLLRLVARKLSNVLLKITP
jgi:hypothetical protein